MSGSKNSMSRAGNSATKLAPPRGLRAAVMRPPCPDDRPRDRQPQARAAPPRAASARKNRSNTRSSSPAGMPGAVVGDLDRHDRSRRGHGDPHLAAVAVWATALSTRIHSSRRSASASPAAPPARPRSARRGPDAARSPAGTPRAPARRGPRGGAGRWPPSARASVSRSSTSRLIRSLSDSDVVQRGAPVGRRRASGCASRNPTLLRIVVSGVRSSCDASAVNRCCAASAAASRGTPPPAGPSSR